MLAANLVCLACRWQTRCGEVELARRLRTLGLFKRAADPPQELVRALLASHAAQLRCDQCGQVGLVAREASGSGSEIDQDGDPDDDQGDWQQAIVCQLCRQPIPPERVEVFPDAQRCAPCQDVADRGAEPEEPEFCEKCGSLVELRVSHAGGLARYKRFCTGSPSCRL
jgi:hypothetical protein